MKSKVLSEPVPEKLILSTVSLVVPDAPVIERVSLKCRALASLASATVQVMLLPVAPGYFAVTVQIAVGTASDRALKALTGEAPTMRVRRSEGKALPVSERYADPVRSKPGGPKCLSASPMSAGS